MESRPQRPGGIDLDEVPATFRPFAKAILEGPDPAPALIRLLGTLGEKAKEGEARDFALLLRRRLPQSSRRDRVTEAFLRKDYPAWYIRAVNDPHRNGAYRRALEALVRPGMIVLEAGTGSGLFAMMAARAGAEHVYTCEKDPQVAAIARENIARNGLGDRISVLDTPHEKLRLGDDLPRRADLLIHEFVASQFVVENIARIAGSLRRTLLTPEAPMLPCRFAAVGMLVGDTWPLDSIRVPAAVEGLDVSAINLLETGGISLAGPVAIEAPLSAPVTLATYDPATDESPARPTRRLDVVPDRSGTATGVLQWIRHEFPDGSVYENRPDLACNWWPCFWPFPAPVPVRAGAPLGLRIETSETEVLIDLITNSGE